MESIDYNHYRKKHDFLILCSFLLLFFDYYNRAAQFIFLSFHLLLLVLVYKQSGLFVSIVVYTFIYRRSGNVDISLLRRRC